MIGFKSILCSIIVLIFVVSACSHKSSPPGVYSASLQQKTFAAGRAHNCYIKPDDFVQCHLSPYFLSKDENINATPFKAKALTAGLVHSCAILFNDTVSCWYDKKSINFGPDMPFERDMRANFSKTENQEVLDIAAGAFHTCAIKAKDHRIRCWGDNTRYQITNIMDRFKDVKVKSIVGGLNILCGIKLDDTVICSNDNTSKNFSKISQTKVKSIQTNGSAACAITQDDTAQCWGEMPLDTGNIFEREIKDKKVLSVALASESACFLLATDNKLHCFGENINSQLDPTAIAKANAVELKAIFAGEFHYCALDVDHKLLCWGWDDDSFKHLKNSQGEKIKYSSQRE